MFKKFLAGLTALVLSLGMVALVAGPASAHSNDITAQVSCNTTADGFWKVTWTIANDYGSAATINTSTRPVVTTPTVVPAKSSVQFVEYFTTQPTGDITLKINSTWPADNYSRDNSQTVKKNQFAANCVPDDTSKKIRICHATSSDTNPYTKPEVAVDSIITNDPNGHGNDPDDIIPSFSYVKQGVPGTYPGKNWTTYGQWVYNNNCSTDVVKPTSPTKTDAVCTAVGASSGSVTIPSNVTGFQYSYRYGNAGGWTDIAQGATLPNLAFGTLVQVRATLLDGYTYSGNWNGWSQQGQDRFVALTIGGSAAATCLAAVPPTFQDALCTEPGTGVTSGYYVINGVAGGHVTYEVKIGAGAWTPVAVNTYGQHIPVAPGTTVEVRAKADGGYTLVGYTPWPAHTFTNPGDCLDDVTPVAPSFTDAICTEPGTGTTGGYYVVNGVVGGHVTYEVKTGAGAWTPVLESTYGQQIPVVPGTTVEVRATADAGYQLVGSGSWPAYTFTNPGDCLDPAPIDPVTAVNQTCVIDDLDTGDFHNVTGYITIPTTEHVTYSVDGIEVGPGKHDYEPGVYAISAEAADGYVLTGVPEPWTVEVKKALPCGLQTFPGVTPKVDFVQTTCTASGSYTLSVIDPVNAAGVIWTVSSGLPATVGTHKVNAAGTVTITAVPAAGYGFDDGIPGPAVREWSYDFASLPDDCLPTLALTGAGVATGGLGLAGLLTLGGILLIAAHRRRGALIEQ